MLPASYATTTYAAADFNSRCDTSGWYRVPCADFGDFQGFAEKVNFAGSSRVMNGTERSKQDMCGRTHPRTLWGYIVCPPVAALALTVKRKKSLNLRTY